MATVWNKQKLAAFDKEKCAEHPRNNLARNSKAPRSQEDYMNQVSEKLKSDKKVLQGVQYDRELHFRCSIATWWVFSQPANTGPLRIRPRDIPERIWHKPRIESWQLLVWSSFWRKRLSESDYAKFWPRWLLRHMAGAKRQIISITKASGATSGKKDMPLGLLLNSQEILALLWYTYQ